MFSCCKDLDLDDLFAYKTYKTVRVRHRTLGLVYYITMIFIFMYTGLYTVWYQEGYVQSIAFVGSVRSTAQQPAVIYPTDPSGLYAQVTSGQDGALMVGSRVSITQQERDLSCANLDYTCNNFKTTVPKQSFYMGGSENSTIVIQNAVSNATQQAYGGSQDLIVDSFITTRPRHDDGSDRPQLPVLPMAYGDQFTVGQLAWVAGLELDAIFNDPTTGGADASLRCDGQTIRIRVVFTGDRTRWDQQAYYQYFVSVNDMEAKTTWTDQTAVPIYTIDPISGALLSNGTNTTRVEYDLHGLQLIYSIEATLNVFNLPTLFLSLLSGAGLLFVAKTTADSFLLYCAPKRKDYRLFVEQLTPDFSPDSAESRTLLEKILHKKRASRAKIEQGRLTMSDAELGNQPLVAADALGALSVSPRDATAPVADVTLLRGRSAITAQGQAAMTSVRGEA
ncbi:p2x receptor [Chrysochromulina tobinii]|uniref:p2x receptor n=1 Tax=Chrysochromulina tobinii TaxID=1460289 RepID=A0A0M0JMJ1_9EUKA|nr:p2x receptor [Chrysochromulina tobinii]|eukprot:KOO27448.1 p2x receptor [Chrysochromulina sp. CCMP291]